jgi:hypothetical protein
VPELAQREPGYETADVRVLWPVLAAAILVVGLAVTLLSARALLEILFTERQAAPSTQLERTQIGPPLPHLEHAPAETLTAVRRHEQQLLESLGWVDRAHGIARIPIEDAMRLLAEQGWPAPDAGSDGRGPR